MSKSSFVSPKSCKKEECDSLSSISELGFDQQNETRQNLFDKIKESLTVGFQDFADI